MVQVILRLKSRHHKSGRGFERMDKVAPLESISSTWVGEGFGLVKNVLLVASGESHLLITQASANAAEQAQCR